MIAVKVVILPLLLACVSSDPKVFLATTGSGPGSAGIPPAQVDYPNRRGVDWKSRIDIIFGIFEYKHWAYVTSAIMSLCPLGEFRKEYRNKKKVKKRAEKNYRAKNQ